MSSIAIPSPLTRRPETARGLRSGLRVLSTVGLVAAIGVWALLLRPQFLGGPAAYVMVSGMSMEPTLHNGDLVVAHRRDTYRVGDVVLYRVPKGDAGAGSMIIHRIVGGSEPAGWIVQGDNKDVPDLWRPMNRDVVGVMRASVPGAGTVLAHLLSPFALASLSTLLTAFLGLPGAAVKRVEDRGTRRRPSEQPESPSVPATVLALTVSPPPTARSSPTPDGARHASSRALAARPAPVVGMPLSIPLVDIPRPALLEHRLALPVSTSAPGPPTREGVAAPGVPNVKRASWGEAAWTARDLAAADRVA